MSQRATGFKSVFDFRSPRSWQAAVGFYFFWLVVKMLIDGVSGLVVVLILGTVDQKEALHIGIRVGMVVGPIVTAIIFGTIITQRKAWKNWRYTASFVATIIMSALIGGLFGLIPPAIAVSLDPPDERKTFS